MILMQVEQQDLFEKWAEHGLSQCQGDVCWMNNSVNKEQKRVQKWEYKWGDVKQEVNSWAEPSPGAR